jgi:hypothetical protein
MAQHLIAELIGGIPYRLALAGGWIDQPFISRHNPSPPGSMVVVGLEPVFRLMDRCGMGTSTRNVAMHLWGGKLPAGDPARLVRALYMAENLDKIEPSGSQDMAGLIYPGINRLDYDANIDEGIFPAHVESCNEPDIIEWLEKVIFLLPVMQRPVGYNPLEEKNLDPQWIQRLGQSGKDCYAAILERNLDKLGISLNECMRCWAEILPNTVRHPTIPVDLMKIWQHYQEHYSGAMYTGCGGGYLIVVSERTVPGGFKIKIRNESAVT